MITVTLTYPSKEKPCFTVELRQEPIVTCIGNVEKVETQDFSTYLVAQNYSDGIIKGLKFAGIPCEQVTKAFHKKAV